MANSQPIHAHAAQQGGGFPTHPLFKNLLGKRFGRLEVVRFAGSTGTPRRVRWECRCDCGTSKVIAATQLQVGTQSCGCLHRETIGNTSRTHGKSKTGEYKIWAKIIERCENKKSQSYPDYGGRGISMCARWRGSFPCFFEDVGARPSPKHEIDRIDNNGNYEPGNCRWVLRTANARNKRNNRLLEWRGEVMCVSQWAERLGVPRDILSTRLRRGWTVEETLGTPIVLTRRGKYWTTEQERAEVEIEEVLKPANP